MNDGNYHGQYCGFKEWLEVNGRGNKIGANIKYNNDERRVGNVCEKKRQMRGRS